MALKINHAVRKSVKAEYVRVTEENMREVVMWCKGQYVLTPPEPDSLGNYVKIRTGNKNIPERLKRAYVGDIVVRMGKNFKVFDDSSFERDFTTMTERACGDKRYTADHEPCVLGAGHKDAKVAIGCRSLTDYKVTEKAAMHRTQYSG